MQYDVSNPTEYLAALEPDWRKEKLGQLRSLILEQSGDLEECINYKMLCYKLGDITVLHLNAQKGYVSLYAGNIEKIDPKGELLSGLNLGKGCVRLSKSKNIASTGLGEFIARAVEIAKQGVDLGC